MKMMILLAAVGWCGCAGHPPAPKPVVPRVYKVHWLGEHYDEMWTESDTNLNVVVDQVTFGIREDGVVIWRKK